MIRAAHVGIAVAACALLAAAPAQARGTRERPPTFGPSYQSPYNFAPPAPIYPTPGGSLNEAPYQGANGYVQERNAPAAVPSRTAPKSQRLDTRIGPAR